MKDEAVGYDDLFLKLERERGFKGALYRQKCLRRRIAVRMRARGMSDPRLYSQLLDEDPAEYDRLLTALTINVSKFFRNPETWDVIKTRVLPRLLERPRPLHIWSAGSAAGEEAYSVAILIREMLGTVDSGGMDDIRIVGSDIDTDVLAQARAARYLEVAFSETPAVLRQRWFGVVEPFELLSPIPSMVEFTKLDILASRPDFSADMILCRNLLIYFDRRAQDQVFRMFADVLKPGGYLVLGRVESLARAARRKFEVIDARERVYRKL